jgi:hypothetical protein
MLPTFLIAGAAKAGSSTLYHYLGSHPQVFMSTEKEPAFFTKHWQQGAEYYARFFEGWSGRPAVGEATVEYMVDPEAPSRIAELLPDVRLIFTLRDPIARAYSHYWHRVKTGHEARALDVVLSGDGSEYPIRYSRYYTHLRRYLSHFSPDQLFIVIMEDMKRDPLGIFRDLFAFIAVDSGFQVDYQGARNMAKTPCSPALQRMLTRIQATAWIQGLVPDSVRPFVASTYTRIKRGNLKPFEAPPLGANQAERLARILVPEIEGIEGLLGRKLTEWRAPYPGLRAAAGAR